MQRVTVPGRARRSLSGGVCAFVAASIWRVRVAVGELEVVFVADGEMSMQPTALMVRSTERDWAARAELLLARDGRLPLSVGGLLVRTAGQLVLVDLGLGPVDAELPDGSGHVHGGRLLDSLRELEVDPPAVGVVVLTHLHPDHVGWTSRDHGAERRLTFANARHFVAPAEWAYWASRRGDLRGPDPDTVLTPLSGRVEPLWDGRQIAPGVTAIATPGHTPGHIAVELHSRDDRAVLAGDVLHAPIQLEHPDWTTMGDVDPELARRGRVQPLERAADSRALVVAIHAGDQMFGTVDRHADGLHWRRRHPALATSYFPRKKSLVVRSLRWPSIRIDCGTGVWRDACSA